jgi:hypothetical protein
MSKIKKAEFFSTMNLTPQEIQTFEKYVNLIEKAEKNGVNFVHESELKAFTPAGLLVVAVARFVYDVVRDYGGFLIDQEQPDFQLIMKGIIKELGNIENSDGDAPSLDVFASVRRDLALSRKK